MEPTQKPGLTPRAPKVSKPSRSLIERLDHWRHILVNSVFFLGALFILFTAVRVILSDRMSIDPVGMPKAMLDMGYRSEEAALQLQDGIQTISQQSKTKDKIFNVSARTEDFDLAVPVEGISFVGMVRFIRQAIGWPQRRLSVDIVCTGDPCGFGKLELRMRSVDETGKSAVFPSIKGNSPDELLERAAQAFVAKENPMIVAVALMNQPGRLGEADTFFDQAITNDESRKPYALALKAMTIANRANGNPEQLAEAESMAKQAIEMAPTLETPYNALAIVQQQQGRLDEGIANYEKSLAIEPNQGFIHNELGNIHLARGKNADARKEYELAATLDPKDADFQVSLGQLALQESRNADAVKHLSQALALNADQPAVQYNLGVAQEALGQKFAAASAFSAYLQMLPNAEDAAAVKQRIEGLK